MPVRFAPDDLKAIEAAARAKNQTISEWVRGTIHGILPQKTRGGKGENWLGKN